MYNEKIESLIKAALADGVLTDKEKQILFRKAAEQGIDLEEFEMVLDARLVEAEQAAASKSNKLGDVKKCPSCGDIVPVLHGVCPTCGYTFNLSKADVDLVAKLERDCQVLSRIRQSFMPILLASNLIYIGISILSVLLDLDGEDVVAIVLGFFMFGNTLVVWFYLLSGGAEQLSATKLQKCVFDIRSKINSTKLLYADNKLIMARLANFEEYINDNLKARNKRSMIIIIIGVIVAIAIPVVGYLMDEFL